MSRRWKNQSEAMAVARRPVMWPPTDMRLALIEEAMAKVKRPEPVPQIGWSAAKGSLEVEKACAEEPDDRRAQEKCMFMNSLGLVRRDHVPTIRDLMNSRQRSRLRPRKPQPPSPELPSRAEKVSLPLSNPVNKGLNVRPEEAIHDDAAILEKKATTKPSDVQRGVPQSDRITRSKGVKRAAVTPSIGETSQSVKTEDGVTPPSKRRTRATVETVQVEHSNHSRPALKAKLRRKSVQEEVGEVQGRKTRSQEARRMMETGKQGVNGAGEAQLVQQAQPASFSSHPVYTKKPVDQVDTVFSDPTSLDRGKRQRRRPIKLLDSDFVFDFMQPAGGAMSAVTTMDICLPRSVSPAVNSCWELPSPITMH